MLDKPAFEVECHCGNLRLGASRVPGDLTQCNCSICRRLGALWAYFDSDEVTVLRQDKPIRRYTWGEKTITYHRCGECGCITHYTTIESDGRPLTAINARMAEPQAILDIPLRHFDGLKSWKYLDA